MAKKVKKAIPWITIFGAIAVIGLVAVLNLEVPKVPEVKADVSTASTTVGNTAPVASAVSLNSSGAITLAEGTTKSVPVTGTVTDDNSCKDLISVIYVMYATGTVCAASGNADDNNCYFYEDTDPANNASCDDDSDTVYAASHSFEVQYFANPATWVGEVIPADEGSGTSDTNAQTLNTLTALDVSATIDYGSVNTGATSSADSTATISNTGNDDIGAEVSSAAAMTCTIRGTIPVANQHYATTTDVTWGDGTPLSGAGTDLGITISKATSGAGSSDDSYWRVKVDTGTEGNCTGTDTFTVVSK